MHYFTQCHFVGTLIFIFLLTGYHFIPQSHAQILASSPSVHKEQILVQTRAGVRPLDLEKSLYPIAGLPKLVSVERVIEVLPVFKISLDQPDLYQEVLERLRSNPMVLTAHYNGISQFRRVPNDELYSKQWALTNIQAAKAWNLVQGTDVPGKKRVIAIIDSGFDRFHEDLEHQIWKNEDEIPGDGLDNDNDGYIDDYYGYNVLQHSDSFYAHYHGTKVAGIIGAKTDNGTGIAGVNWNVQLMTVALGKSSDIEDDLLLRGLQYVYKQRRLYNTSGGTNGAYVVAVNLSLGRGGKVSTFPEICRIMDKLGEEGVLTVGATSNSNSNVDLYGDLPCDCGSEYLVCVTASDQNDKKLVNAAYGKRSIDLAAPGKAILSTTYSSEALYSTGTGTSFAAPMVTGAVGLLYSLPCEKFQNEIDRNPADAAILVRNFIFAGVDVLSSFDTLSSTEGRLNLFTTLKLAKDEYCEQDAGSLSIEYIHPNPVSTSGGSLKVAYQISQYSLYYYRIIDASGKVILEATFWPALGEDKVLDIDISLLSAGTYAFQLFNDYEKVAAKFVVSY